MIVKAGGIRNLTDARYFAAREAAFLGFNLEAGTPGYLDPIYMKAIREWVEGPEIVGEFSVSSAEVVHEAASFFQLDAVQLSAGYLDVLDELTPLKILLHLNACEGAGQVTAQMQAAAGKVAFFILDFSGCGALTDDPAWVNLCEHYPVLLHLDGPVDTYEAIRARLNPAGLSFSGGEEERVGVKSFDDIEAILDSL